LLPTITSRTQHINLPHISSALLQKHAAQYAAKLDAQQLAQLLFVANGRPGVLVTLLNNPETFDDHKALMQQAKQLLAASSYERLAAINELVKDKHRLIETLEAMGHMLHVHVMRDPQPRLLTFADKLEQCLTRLAQNGNPRAQLTALFAD
jgi:hypothetical protein